MRYLFLKKYKEKIENGPHEIGVYPQVYESPTCRTYRITQYNICFEAKHFYYLVLELVIPTLMDVDGPKVNMYTVVVLISLKVE